MSLTLLEAAKIALDEGKTKAAGVIATFAQESAWLRSLVFQNIPGNSYGYNAEQTLPGIAFRGVNEAYTESTGIINPQAEALKIAGGDLDVDVSILKMFGDDVRAVHESMKAKALAAALTLKLIKGDSTAQPREFDGLQNRLLIGGPQVIEAGSTNGGDALSLLVLNQAIDQTAGASAIWCSKNIRRRFTQARNDYTIGGFITQDVDAFGRPQMSYNGLPILVPYEDNGGVEPIDNLEVGSGGATATATSLYVVGVGDGLMRGIQNGVMDVRDLGELQTAPVKRTRVEWLVGLVLEHPRCVTRLRGILPTAAFVK